MVPDAVDLAAVARALVIKLRHHGDVLLASPVFSALKAAAPHVEIDALVYDDTREMLTQHPAIHTVHTVGRRWRELALPRKLAAEMALLQALRARRYDLLMTLTDSPRGAALARLLAPRHAVAPDDPARGRIWKRAFTHRYRLTRTRRHTVEVHLDALRRIGVQPGEDERRLVLVTGDEAEADVQSRLAALGLAEGGFVHLHPTSRWLFKGWTVAANAALIDALAARGERVVITAAPSAVERAMVERILAACRSQPVDLAGQLSLKGLAALTRRARIFVGVDSAPMHIAAAMGTPVVALFGPSGEIEWQPWRTVHRVVASQAHPCRPCGNDGCGGGKVSECLTTLGPAAVLEAIDAVLACAREALPCPQNK
jgi:heptosyltransferase-3